MADDKPTSHNNHDNTLDAFSTSRRVQDILNNQGRNGELKGRVAGTIQNVGRNDPDNTEKKKKEDDKFRMVVSIAITPAYTRWVAAVDNYNDCMKNVEELQRFFVSNKILMSNYQVGVSGVAVPVRGNAKDGYYIEDPLDPDNPARRKYLSKIEVDSLKDYFKGAESLDERLEKSPAVQQQQLLNGYKRLQKAILKTEPALEEALDADAEVQKEGASGEPPPPGTPMAIAVMDNSGKTYPLRLNDKGQYYVRDLENPNKETLVPPKVIEDYKKRSSGDLTSTQTTVMWEDVMKNNKDVKDTYDKARGKNRDTAPVSEDDFTRQGMGGKGSLVNSFGSVNKTLDSTAYTGPAPTYTHR